MINFNSVLQNIIRIFFDISALLYLVFAVVVVKQVTTMSKNVSDKFNAILVAFSYLHLVFALVLLLLTVVLTL